MRAWAVLPLALLAASAAAGPAKDDDPLAGRVAGAAVDCISLGTSQGPSIADDGAILYRQSGKRIWRTNAIGQCTILRPFDTLIVEVFGGQLCRNDRFRTLSPGLTIASTSCRFDRFVPYDKP